MRAVVFVNGQVTDYTAMASWLMAGDRLIAADGGALHCLAIGRTPDVVVGDLDSIPPAVLAALEADGVTIERYPVAKDQTDLELAIDRALADGADEVLILGALGGRLDHTIANLMILAQKRWQATIRLAEGSEIAQILHGGEVLEINGPIGSTVSAIPMSARVDGLTYTGLEYPLNDATLELGSTRGVSNTVVNAPATLTLAAGILLVIHDNLRQSTIPTHQSTVP